MGNLLSITSHPVRYNLDKETIKSIERNLANIQILLHSISIDRDSCLRNYKKWVAGRCRTLSVLLKCQDELDSIHKCSSGGQAVGNGVSILGGLTTIVGLGLSLSKDLRPVGKELIKYGSAVGAAGGATSIVSSLAGMGFSAKVLREVKLALQEDERLTRDLLPWLNRAVELQCLFQQVFDCSAMDGLSDVFTAVREICSLCSKGSKALADVTEYLSLSLMKADISPKQLRKLNNMKLERILCNASEKVTMLLLGLCQSPEILESVGSLCDFFMKSSDLFQLPRVASCIMRDMLGQENVLCHVISLIGGNQSITLSHGLFQAVSILPKVYAFLSAVQDMKHGKSKYWKIIEETKGCLRVELEILESYPELKSA